MAQIVTLHSYRGGTGKSTTVANVALLAAAAGRRVAVVDTDIQTPGLHMFFGMGELSSCRSLADYLVGNCEITDAAADLPAAEASGSLYVVRARSRLNEVNEILMRGYDIGLLSEGFNQLIEDLRLDLVFLDTHTGMGNETAVAIAVSTSLLVITRPDHLIPEAVENISRARRLGHPSTSVVVNMVPEGMAGDTVRLQAEQTYKSPVIATMPYFHEVATLGSNGVFARERPEHSIVTSYQEVANLIIANE
jgi:MinD-like ATPase involved in chromosome partitioning or flagellar assembly